MPIAVWDELGKDYSLHVNIVLGVFDHHAPECSAQLCDLCRVQSIHTEPNQ